MSRSSAPTRATRRRATAGTAGTVRAVEGVAVVASTDGEAAPADARPAVTRLRAKTPAASDDATAKPKKASRSASASKVAKPAGKARQQDATDAGERKHARRKLAAEALAGKLVRDRFTMPAADHDLIKLLKQRATAAGRPTRKNELLRAGLHALRESGTIELVKVLDRLAPVAAKRGKSGRDD